MGQGIKLKANLDRIAFIPKFSEELIKAEPVLLNVDFEYAAANSGKITQFILSELLNCPEFQELEKSEAVKNNNLVPTISTLSTFLYLGQETEASIWKTEKIPSKTNNEYKYFSVIVSAPLDNSIEGVQHTLFIKEDFVCDLELNQSDVKIFAELNKYIYEASTIKPPKMKIQIDGELLMYGTTTVFKSLPAHNSGWTYKFNLTYGNQLPAYTGILK